MPGRRNHQADLPFPTTQLTHSCPPVLFIFFPQLHVKSGIAPAYRATSDRARFGKLSRERSHFGRGHETRRKTQTFTRKTSIKGENPLDAGLRFRETTGSSEYSRIRTFHSPPPRWSDELPRPSVA